MHIPANDDPAEAPLDGDLRRIKEAMEVADDGLGDAFWNEQLPVIVRLDDLARLVREVERG